MKIIIVIDRAMERVLRKRQQKLKKEWNHKLWNKTIIFIICSMYVLVYGNLFEKCLFRKIRLCVNKMSRTLFLMTNKIDWKNCNFVAMSLIFLNADFWNNFTRTKTYMLEMIKITIFIFLKNRIESLQLQSFLIFCCLFPTTWLINN